MALKFIQDGDYVNFFHDSYHVIRLHNTSRVVTWFYNDTGGLIFTIDQLRYQVDSVADITFNGTPLASQGQFKTKIIEFFPDLAPGGAGGGVTTMGSVGAGDAEGAVITGSTLALHKATEDFPGLVSADGTVQTFGGPKSFSGTVQFQNSALYESNFNIKELNASPSAPGVGRIFLYGRNDKKLYFKNSDDVEFGLTPGIDTVLSQAQALTEPRTLHLGGFPYYFENAEGQYFLEADPTLDAEVFKIAAYSGSIVDSYSKLDVRTNNLESTFDLVANFNSGAAIARIESLASGTTGLINYIANTHDFQNGDVKITALAGGGTTGLSIDNDGKIIRTP